LSNSQKSQIFENLCELIQIAAFKLFMQDQYLLILLWLNFLVRYKSTDLHRFLQENVASGTSATVSATWL
jgi:hypothetical protein